MLPGNAIASCLILVGTGNEKDVTQIDFWAHGDLIADSRNEGVVKGNFRGRKEIVAKAKRETRNRRC